VGGEGEFGDETFEDTTSIGRSSAGAEFIASNASGHDFFHVRTRFMCALRASFSFHSCRYATDSQIIGSPTHAYLRAFGVLKKVHK
jgi:hypothetical protein